MTIIKIRRGRSHHRVDGFDIPFYDYFIIEGVNSIVTRLTPLNSKDEGEAQ